MTTYEDALAEPSEFNPSAIRANPKLMTIAGWILTVLVGALLIFSAVMKLMQTEMVIEGFKQQGFPDGVAVPIGIVELACALLFLLPRTAVLGAILIAAYLGGATCTHVHQGLPVYMPVIIGIVAWAGLYLRDSRIRTLIPLRSKS